MDNYKLFGLIIFGAVLGAMCGIILEISLMTLGTASLILSGSRYTIPIWSTGIIMVITIVPLLTYNYWIDFAENSLYVMADLMSSTKAENEDDDNEDDET